MEIAIERTQLCEFEMMIRSTCSGLTNTSFDVLLDVIENEENMADGIDPALNVTHGGSPIKNADSNKYYTCWYNNVKLAFPINKAPYADVKTVRKYFKWLTHCIDTKILNDPIIYVYENRSIYHDQFDADEIEEFESDDNSFINDGEMDYESDSSTNEVS